jgi:hypothetical protein
LFRQLSTRSAIPTRNFGLQQLSGRSFTKYDRRQKGDEFVSKIKRIWLVVVGVVALLGVLGSVAYSVTTSQTGTTADSQYFFSDDVAWTTTSTVWTTVPGSWGTVTIAGSNHMIDARFTAESLCENASWCAARITVDNAAHLIDPLIELSPSSGSDYAFDTPGGYEGHAMERFSVFLSPGTYNVRVQAAVVGGGSFRLDDRSLVVELVGQ